MGYRDYSTAKGHIVDAGGTGDFTTIAAALTAASSGQTIFIRPGTYTENPTLKAGVDLVAFNDAPTGNVIINGKCTFTGAGKVTLAGLYLQTNSDFLLAVTGSAASIVSLNNCYLNMSNNTGISYTSSSASSRVNLYTCLGDLGTTGIGIFANTGAGQLIMNFCSFTNTGASTTASTIGAGADFNSYMSIYGSAFSTSSSGSVQMSYCNVNTGSINTTCLTTAGTGTATLEYSDFVSGTASALSIGAGTTVQTGGPINVTSSNTHAITGAGTIDYAFIAYTGSSSNNNTTTQTAYPIQIATIPVADGGTGATTLTGLLTGNGTSPITGTAITQYNVITGGASNAPNSVAPSATSGVPLISQGSASQPVFGTAVVAGGGTGDTSFTAYAVICGGTTTTGALQSIASVGSSGALLTSNGAGALPTFNGGTTQSWTPQLNFGGAHVGMTFSVQTASYNQQGNIVHFIINLTLSNKGSSTGAATITGWPVAIGSLNPTSVIPTNSFNSITLDAGYTDVFLQAASSTVMNVNENGSNKLGSQLQDTNFAATSALNISGFYFTN